jgi:hypothetical protein
MERAQTPYGFLAKCVVLRTEMPHGREEAVNGSQIAALKCAPSRTWRIFRGAPACAPRLGLRRQSDSGDLLLPQIARLPRPTNRHPLVAPGGRPRRSPRTVARRADLAECARPRAQPRGQGIGGGKDREPWGRRPLLRPRTGALRGVWLRRDCAARRGRAGDSARGGVRAGGDGAFG